MDRVVRLRLGEGRQLVARDGGGEGAGPGTTGGPGGMEKYKTGGPGGIV